jgi:hypothetical protein
VTSGWQNVSYGRESVRLCEGRVEKWLSFLVRRRERNVEENTLGYTFCNLILTSAKTEFLPKNGILEWTDYM